jgi:peptidoglycan/xylan/chitin deacetylase (PgdA/CDA1 family)
LKSSVKQNAIVLHRVVNHSPVDFIDISLATLKLILSKSRYNFVSIEEAFQAKPQDEANICLTFDDGFLSDYDLVLPELKNRNATATFFIVTDFLDTPGYLTTNQVRILSESGMQIGSHSKTHPNFFNLSLKEKMLELTDSKAILEKIIGKEVSTFSFPFGLYDDECADTVFSAGYSFCCTSKHGISSGLSFMVPRNSINAHMSPSRIEKILRAGFSQRLRWFFEDNSKDVIKSLIGRERYIKLRDKILHE